ncbi:MAG: RNA polymerase-binding protein DksA [Candidatus Lambdaproteobacteria bacterium]|nr:RNA polymerase-binding protein DksA [Candidatus Lambdaproteobacteria bacterium]
MDHEKLQRFQERLAGMLSRLEEDVSHTVEGMREEAAPFPDPTDRASVESERNLTLRIRDRERKLRAKVEEALARIDDGSFGICEVCGEEIGEHRLLARPVTTLCINCKSDQEEDELRRNQA